MRLSLWKVHCMQPQVACAKDLPTGLNAAAAAVAAASGVAKLVLTS